MALSKKRRSQLYILFPRLIHRALAFQNRLRESRLAELLHYRRLDLLFAERLRQLFERAGTLRDGNVKTHPKCVMLVIGTLGPGGAERQLVNTALALAADGRYRPLVTCMHLGDGDAFYRPMLEEAGIKIIDLEKADFSAVIKMHPAFIEACRAGLAGLPYHLSEVMPFLLLLLQEKPGIVHSFLDETNVKSGIAAVLAGVPKIILSLRNMAPDKFLLYRKYMRLGYQALLKRADVRFCSNSRAGAIDYQRWLDERLSIDVINNGIDFEKFPRRSAVDRGIRVQYGIPEDALVIGSVMRLHEEKQPLLWAKAVCEIAGRRPHVHFALAGIGPLRNLIDKTIKAAGMQSRVHLLGQIRDIAEVMRGFDIFLLTSRLEGFPNVLVEAQAIGLPVITTPAGGAAETIEHGRTGLVTGSQDAESIVRACLQLIDDAELRLRFAKAGPEFVREKFSVEKMLGRTLALYDG